LPVGLFHLNGEKAAVFQGAENVGNTGGVTGDVGVSRLDINAGRVVFQQNMPL
jgi:hypothetical protein